jgi:predicted transposase YbfD/YdcC
MRKYSLLKTRTVQLKTRLFNRENELIASTEKEVNRHQDRINKGWAISNEDHEEDMALIKKDGSKRHSEKGKNTISVSGRFNEKLLMDDCIWNME